MSSTRRPPGTTAAGTAPAPAAHLDSVVLREEEPRRAGLLEQVESGATITFFLVMFGTLLLGVLYRYVLDDPLVWTVGVSTAAYVWIITLGAGLANWDDDHIQVDLLYQRYPPEVQTLARIIGNLLIIVPFAIAVPGTLAYLRFVHPVNVTGTPIPQSFAFAGMLIFLVVTVLHRGRLLVGDLRSLRRGGGGR